VAPLETAPAVKRAALSGVKLHFPDGRAWDGVGEWGYVRETVDLNVQRIGTEEFCGQTICNGNYVVF